MKKRTFLQAAASWLVSKAYVGPVDLSAFDSRGWKSIIGEPFSGAWQRNISCDLRGSSAFSAVYSCISLRARDISKLRIKLMQQNEESGVWKEVRRDSPFLPVLAKPNRYQTRIQFLQYWIVCKLLYGNVYVFKTRDQRGMVTGLYLLDPRRVTAKVGSDGSIWYDVAVDFLSGVTVQDTVSASEIIHDRCMPLFHPLIGISPIYAAGMSSAQGLKIQENSATFFANMSAPSGHLSAPGTIQDVTAARMKRDAEGAMSGANSGRLFVSGDGIKYEQFGLPAVDAQLIEQLRWTVEDVARCFGVPLHKIMAGAIPQVGNMAALDQGYYSQTLQEDIESIELLLDEGLRLTDVDGKTYGTELELEGLLRMDPIARAERLSKMGGILTPNEMRSSENYERIAEGGDEVYLQQQNYSTGALAKRDAKPDPFATTPSVAPASAAPAANDPNAQAAAAKALQDFANAAFDEMSAVRAETKAALDKMAADIPEAIAKAMPQPVVDESSALMARLREKFLAV